jgi:hypothetical protein
LSVRVSATRFQLNSEYGRSGISPRTGSTPTLGEAAHAVPRDGNDAVRFEQLREFFGRVRTGRKPQLVDLGGRVEGVQGSIPIAL